MNVESERVGSRKDSIDVSISTNSFECYNKSTKNF